MESATTNSGITVAARNATAVPLRGSGPDEVLPQMMKYAVVDVGANPEDNELTVTATFPPAFFSVPRPINIHLQPRQGANADYGFPDQFSLMVIMTGTDFISFRVRRIDTGQADGWGQDLEVDIFVIDDGSQPATGA